jgi:hypothetical protein
MKTDNKTHYRKVFKSDHLGSADLEEMIEDKKRLVFTIEKVLQYIKTNDKNSGVSVAGKRISANIAYLKGAKPLVLNATNSKVMAKMMDSKFVDDWAGAIVELYIDPNVKMKGEIVGGVRIKPTAATPQKPKLTPAHKNWDKAKIAVTTGEADLDTIRENWDITQENFDLLCG